MEKEETIKKVKCELCKSECKPISGKKGSVWHKCTKCSWAIKEQNNEKN